MKFLIEMVYTATVKTGSEFGSSTTADIYCILEGTFGDTGKRHLLKSQNATKFQLSQVDTFQISCVDLGSIKNLKLGHTKFGRGRGWFCERATLKIGENEDELYFPCHK
jgi:hypothetical protein